MFSHSRFRIADTAGKYGITSTQKLWSPNNFSRQASRKMKNPGITPTSLHVSASDFNFLTNMHNRRTLILIHLFHDGNTPKLSVKMREETRHPFSNILSHEIGDVNSFRRFQRHASHFIFYKDIRHFLMFAHTRNVFALYINQMLSEEDGIYRQNIL